MLELNPFFSTTLQFEVNQIEKVPENAYNVETWEQGRGVYYCKENDNLYFVGKYSVDNIYSVSDKGFFTVVENTFETPKVDEHLMLKIVAATHGHL